MERNGAGTSGNRKRPNGECNEETGPSGDRKKTRGSTCGYQLRSGSNLQRSSSGSNSRAAGPAVPSSSGSNSRSAGPAVPSSSGSNSRSAGPAVPPNTGLKSGSTSSAVPSSSGSNSRSAFPAGPSSSGSNSRSAFPAGPSNSGLKSSSASSAVPSSSGSNSRSAFNEGHSTSRLTSSSAGPAVPSTSRLISSSAGPAVPSSSGSDSRSAGPAVPSTSRLASSSAGPAVPSTSRSSSSSAGPSVPSTSASNSSSASPIVISPYGYSFRADPYLQSFRSDPAMERMLELFDVLLCKSADIFKPETDRKKAEAAARAAVFKPVYYGSKATAAATSSGPSSSFGAPVRIPFMIWDYMRSKDVLLYYGNMNVVKVPYSLTEHCFEKRVILCEGCMATFPVVTAFQHTVKTCLRPEFTKAIYSHNGVTVYEIDPEHGQKLLLENLRLILKMFYVARDGSSKDKLEDKYFYVMTKLNNSGRVRIVGYFSRPKRDAIPNLNEILILPEYQRKGYGTLLVELSFYISRIRNEEGAPVCLNYAAQQLYDKYYIFALLSNMQQKYELSVEMLCLLTGMTQDEIRIQAIRQGFCRPYELLVKATPHQLMHAFERFPVTPKIKFRTNYIIGTFGQRPKK